MDHVAYDFNESIISLRNLQYLHHGVKNLSIVTPLFLVYGLITNF